MNEYHEANRRGWEARARAGGGQIDQSKQWRDCFAEAARFFLVEELTWLADIAGKSVCVLGSGDNLAAFALASMGARVTSVDIAEEQLRIAAERAEEVGADIHFVRADVTNLAALPDESFDYVYTGGHVAVWVADLWAYYREAVRILVPGGHLIINEYHPFRRAIGQWDDRLYHYFDRGPFTYDSNENLHFAEIDTLPAYEFQWTVSDFVTAVQDAGATLLQLREVGDGRECWEEMDLTGLPLCLLLLAQKVVR